MEKDEEGMTVRVCRCVGQSPIVIRHCGVSDVMLMVMVMVMVMVIKMIRWIWLWLWWWECC